MIKFLVKKTLGWLAMIFLAVNLTYFLASFFLNPRSNYVGRRPPVPESRIDAILTPLNLNDKEPLLERWWHWLSNIVLHWDWGSSPLGDSVNSQISYRIWVSAQLLLLATIISVLLGVGIGVFTASRQYKAGDRVFQFISILTMNIHVVVASIVVVWLAIKTNQTLGTNLFFVTGSSSVGVEGFLPKLVDYAQHLILPTVSLIIISYASYHFLQRSILLDIARQHRRRLCAHCPRKGINQGSGCASTRSTYVHHSRSYHRCILYTWNFYWCDHDRNDLRLARDGAIFRLHY